MCYPIIAGLIGAYVGSALLKRRRKSKKQEEIKYLQEKISQIKSLPSKEKKLKEKRKKLKDLEKEITLKKNEMKTLSEYLGADLERFKELEIKINEIEKEVKALQDYDRKLSEANNGYERALIHEEIEDSFNDGKPLKVLNQKKREKKQLERNLEKLTKTIIAKEKTFEHIKNCDTVILDFMNIFHAVSQNDHCIKNIVNALKEKYKKIILITDPSYPKKTRFKTEEEFKNFFHTAECIFSQYSADKELLQQLKDNLKTLLISNDSFGDYNFKKEKERLFKFTVTKINFYSEGIGFLCPI